ncbi:MAG: hypothetical protein ABIA11_00270 [Patescibacteria group bacterium]
MKIKLKHILGSFFILLTLFLGVSKSYAEEQCIVNAYFFYSNTCPHCHEEQEFLNTIKSKYKNVVFHELEISENRENLDAFIKVGNELGIRTGAVPFFIIGDQYIIGYGTDETTGVQIENLIKESLENPSEDIVSNFHQCELTETQETTSPINTPKSISEIINIPFFGKVDATKLSLPALTFVIALLDGFNPCAMWVLLFLISLLLGMQDRKKMWVLGGVFIGASGFVYFLFLSAWLNFFLFLGFATAVRYVIGLLATGTGSYYLYDFVTNPHGACKVTGGEKRKKTFEKIKDIVTKNNIFLAILGMILLAFAVNVVELLCSAGLPAIYTKLLTLTPLPTWKYYIYLLFYILVFMLDDMIIFAIAMKTLHAVGVTGKFSRYSHLIGGIIILAIGILMLFKPEILMFG